MANDARHVVVLGIDGLRPDLVTESTMPHLVALAKDGTWNRRHSTVFPSETRGALTALATGATAQVNGIAGNQFYVRGTSPDQVFTETTHDWWAADERLAGDLVKAPSISEVLHQAGRPFAVVTSSGPGALPALNWKGQQRGQTGFNVRHPQIGYPHSFAARAHHSLKIPAGGISADGPMTAFRVFEREIWPYDKPATTILWCTEVDSVSHLHGLQSSQLLEKMRGCDDVIGELRAWRDAQPERDNITLFIVSDHGHVTIGGTVNVADALCQVGFKAAASFNDDATQVLVRPGRAVGLWLKQDDPALLHDIRDFMMAQIWFGGAFSPAREPGSTNGMVDGSLALELLGAGGERAPHLFIHLGKMPAGDQAGYLDPVFYDPGDYDLRVGGGTHGGLHRGEFTAVLAGYGAGLAQGRVSDIPSSITDIAPTILSLLGIDAPKTMTGRVLAEVCGDAPESEELASAEILSAGGCKNTLLAGIKRQGHFHVSEGGIEGC
ncbi:alkaline phosphatase family protein [Mesorhizobium sp. BH1-1-4]|uniref:alkaline phosphatase family protein n=1 Tax=Mesorhizobium sp. BH1-1-4 TaxID=2876662 RepID=UPI001CD16E31|nr:alkaline phosphatase family protein [Mesorhizobium sp. BH1-1-4]MBZ9993980.1 alkaline phosphatase family protein [Mesorhizobium sp. BH1-1-4]